MMQSRIIGLLEHNNKDLQKDLETIKKFHFNDEYKEYFFGSWRSCPLWNRDGNSEDSYTYFYKGAGKETQYLQQVPYLKNLITTLFNTQLLKSARLFSMSKESFSIPHRDFVELTKEYCRIHIPLQAGKKSYHSEENVVFSMKQGDIWHLNANNVHSVGYFSTKDRLHLVLDFQYQNNLSAIFNNESHYLSDIPFYKIKRPELNQADYNKISSLSNIISNETFFQVVEYLSKIHFFKNVDSRYTFKWLYEIIHSSKNNDLLNKAETLEESCLLRRETGNLPLQFMK